MLTLLLILLLFSNSVTLKRDKSILNSVTLRRDKSILFSIIVVTSLLLTSFLTYNNLYVRPLEEGIGIYGGLFNETVFIQWFNMFIAFLNLMLSTFVIYVFAEKIIDYSVRNEWFYYIIIFSFFCLYFYLTMREAHAMGPEEFGLEEWGFTIEECMNSIPEVTQSDIHDYNIRQSLRKTSDGYIQDMIDLFSGNSNVSSWNLNNLSRYEEFTFNENLKGLLSSERKFTAVSDELYKLDKRYGPKSATRQSIFVKDLILKLLETNKRF